MHQEGGREQIPIKLFGEDLSLFAHILTRSDLAQLSVVKAVIIFIYQFIYTIFEQIEYIQILIQRHAGDILQRAKHTQSRGERIASNHFLPHCVIVKLQDSNDAPHSFSVYIVQIQLFAASFKQASDYVFQTKHHPHCLQFRLPIHSIHGGDARGDVSLIIDVFPGAGGFWIKDLCIQLPDVGKHLADRTIVIPPDQAAAQTVLFPGIKKAVAGKEFNDIIGVQIVFVLQEEMAVTEQFKAFIIIIFIDCGKDGFYFLPGKCKQVAIAQFMPA